MVEEATDWVAIILAVAAVVTILIIDLESLSTKSVGTIPVHELLDALQFPDPVFSILTILLS